MSSLPKLLVVDDDSSLAKALALALHDTYDVDIAANGTQALFKVDNEQYGAIILDLNLPDIAGLAICQQLRKRGVAVPILILSGEARVLTKINLLDAGANDYLTKPFSLGELKARLRVLLRDQPERRPLARKLRAGGLLLDRQMRTVTRDGMAISLRRKEFALLECLMEHAGNVVTRATLIRHAWQGAEDPWTYTIDVHIKYLRDKLDRPFESAIIQTVH
ncbi:MAG TPA: response regulator transcription factor, partial [Candidatus Saccharimonadales bacterium]|nr:response regulator transcription factor [Candidatus Saccharimonadales bacterium]